MCIQPGAADGGKGGGPDKYQLDFPVIWTAVGGPQGPVALLCLTLLRERQEAEAPAGERSAGAST